MQKIIFMPLRKKIFVLLVLIGGAFTTSFIRQIPKQKETDLAKEANRMMWNSLHLGNYDSIPELLQKLNKAYSENSNDFKIVAHLGFVHLWAFSERGRKAADPTIIDHIYLSNQYLKEAIKLNPDDPRLRGFQSSTEIAQGVISQKYNLVLKGYINSLKAINKWHIFNMSALSLIESQLDSGSVLYKQGIKYQWKVIDECSCKKLDEETIMASPQKVLTDFDNSIGVKGKKIVLYNFVKEEFFINEIDYRLPSHKLKLVAVGNLKDVKNYQLLIDSFKSLKNFNVSIDIYGEGADRKILEQQIAEFDLPVRLMGIHEKIYEILPAYDAFVMCSFLEGFGISAAEAMAIGLPLLLSDIDSLREISQGNAMFFDPYNPQSFIHVVIKIINGESDLKQLSVNGKKISKENFTKEKYLKGLFKLYDEVPE